MRVPPGVADNLGEAGPGTSPGACGRSPDAGRAQAIPRHEGASFVSFLPLQQKIGHPPGTGASEASRGALRLPRESPRHAGGIIPPSCSPRPDWGILRARAWARVVDTDARCRHCEGVVDIVRGSSTPRGGYNARSCQQRASVPISHADRRQRASASAGASTTPVAFVGTKGEGRPDRRPRRLRVRPTGVPRPLVALSPGAVRTPPRPPQTRPGEGPRRRLRCARGRSRRRRRTARKRR
mgnify:CR=1 FL=1